MTKADMTALAERLEAATGGDADLFWEAFRLTQASNDPATFVRASQRFGELIDAKAFESAAMMLVPEGYVLSLNATSDDEKRRHTSDIPLSDWIAMLIRQEHCGYRIDFRGHCRHGCAATPALALAAAAIRARASQEDE